MSDKNEFFNLDDILADFSSYSSSIVNSEQPAPKASEKAGSSAGFTKPAEPETIPEAKIPSQPERAPMPRKAVPETELFDFDFKASDVASESVYEAAEEFRVSPAEAKAPQRPARPAAPQRPVRPAAPQAKRPAPQARPERAAVPDDATRAIPNVRRRDVNFDPERLGMTGKSSPADVRTRRSPSGQRPAAPVPSKKAQAPAVKRPAPAEAPAAPTGGQRAISGILSIVFAVFSLFVVFWVFVNVHPDSGTTVGSSLKSKVNMVEKFDNYANNAASDALGELAYIPKIYTIAEDVNVAPKPNPANFGSTTDPQEVMKVIEDAAALLGDQEVAFDPNANFIPGSQIQYYRDDTILAIAWKEDNSGKCCSCAEVKIAHGSQIRRKVAGDTYSVGKRYYASDMAKECNSVVAINGDFYDFRPIGITVFQRELFRFNPGKLDSCHINSSGDFIFTYADELTDEESTRQFIKDNDIVFSLSFGPILIDNGEFRPIGGYPIGEVNTTYSRSAIGMLDNLHYMLMTVNYDVGYTTAATLNEIGRYMEGKGCQKAYALDGGQTSVLMMNGELVNHVDYGNERTMSDIIYFATAIPEEEAVK